MDQRIVAVVGAFDANGVYGIGCHLPWENTEGKSGIPYDMLRFRTVTKESAPEGKTNVLIAGRHTAETFHMRPLAGRHLVVISSMLDEGEVNAGRSEEEKIVVARGLIDALEKAKAFDDCGHIFFIGGHMIWQRALSFHLCTHAFITIVKRDTTIRAAHKGELHAAPEMLREETYGGMKAESIAISDYWGEEEVDLEFLNYKQ